MAQWNFNCNNCIYSKNGMACNRTACTYTPPIITHSTHTGGAISVTEKMINFATAISETLHLQEPDYSDFQAVADFIGKNKDDYYQRLYDNNEI